MSSAAPPFVLVLVQSSIPGSHRTLYSGIIQEAWRRGVTVHIQLVPPSEEASVLDPVLQHPALVSGEVSGIILIHRWGLETITALSRRWPVVSIVYQYPGANLDIIAVDERGGINNLVTLLQRSGPAHIGFYGLCREVTWSSSRLFAYIASLQRLRLPYVPDYVVEITLREAISGSYTITPAAAAELQALVRQGVTAWLCPSVATAYALCGHFLASGLRIPQDVSLAAFHINLPTPPGFPRLTGVDISSEPELGAAALRRLLDRLENPVEPNDVQVLPVTSVEGETIPA